jgi:polyhydroxyalkanoate synthesis repressor PhaR
MNEMEDKAINRRLIKKYPNRRLYDTGLGHYTTLEELRALVLKNVDVRVIEQSSGRDVTRLVLLQVIAKQQRSAESLTEQDLVELIRSYAALRREEIPKYPGRQLQTANDESRRPSYQLLKGQEAERAHLARELHDDIGQTLAGLSLSMNSGPESAFGAVSREVVLSWRTLIQEVLEQLRALTNSLHPLALTHLGVAAAIQAHAGRLQRTSGMEIRVDVKTDIGPLAQGLELTCFRIVQEALSNALKHSGAHTVWIALGRIENNVHLEIRDDGNGFDVEATQEKAIIAGRVGLFSMRERASMAAGHLSIVSEAGRGTKIIADLPYQQ